MTSRSGNTKISVIIPTAARIELLRKALVALSSQDADPESFEVIVVDNRPSAECQHLVESISGLFSALTYCPVTKPGLHIARHAGLHAAEFDILAYIDDDVVPANGWIRAIQNVLSDASVMMAGGKILPQYENNPPPWVNALWCSNKFGRSLGLFSLLDFGDTCKEIPPGFIWGCNFVIRKQALLDIGGFHPDAMPEGLIRFRGDGESAVSEAALRRNWKTVYDPAVAVHHFVPASRMTKEYVYRRAFQQGISDSFRDIRCGTTRHIENPGVMTKILRKFRLLLRRHGDILRLVEDGLSDGYTFHQREVGTDPDLLNWVRRPTFLGDD